MSFDDVVGPPSPRSEGGYHNELERGRDLASTNCGILEEEEPSGYLT